LLSLQQNYRSAGISWYIYNLLRQLDQGQATYQYTAFLHDRVFQASRRLRLHYSPFSTAKPIARILWEQLFQPIALKQAKVDLYHALAFVAPLALPCPFVMTIYDLSFRRYPEAFRPFNRFYLNTFTRQSAKRAQAIITISESTRQDVIRFFNVAPEKVCTIYCGVDDTFQPLPPAQVEAFRSRQGLPDQFVLFLGTIEPRKNVAGLIKAYSAWHKQDKRAPKLFVGGGKGWYYEQVFELVTQLGLAEKVIFPGYLPQEDLRLWYNAATMFVYPSYFEGFGLPVLEAMACGTPVITSNVSSLPEVAGDAALLIDPTDTNLLAQTMYQVFSDFDLRQTIRRKGLMRGAMFSWQKTANETNDLYSQTLSATRR